MLRTLAIFILLAAVAIGILTRTQFGRDILRGQVERTFNREFEGSISIGQLRGNLVQELFASDVQLRDPEGNLVVTADSVALKPHWRSLFRNAFIADEIELFDPAATLSQDSTGRWNIARALQSRGRPSSTSNPIDLHSGRLIISNGTVTTRSPFATASDNFDYRNTSLRSLNTVLELNMSDTGTFATINELAAFFPDQNVTIESLSGEFGLADDQIRFDEMELVTDRSSIRGTFSMESLTSALPERPVRISIDEGALNLADIRSFFPSVALYDQVSVTGQIDGTVRSLHVDELRIARGDSRIQTQGRLTGLPDSLGFTLSTSNSTFLASDLTALLPGSELPRELTQLGLAEISGDFAGGIRSGPEGLGIRVEGDVSAITDAGDWEGYIQLASLPGRAFQYTVDGTTSEFNPGVLLSADTFSGSLNGTVFASNSQGVNGTETEFLVALGSSELAGRSADSLRASGTYAGGVLESEVVLQQEMSRLNGQLTFDSENERIAFDGDVTALDLRRLSAGLPYTRLTGAVSLETQGLALSTITGRFETNLTEGAIDVNGETHFLPQGQMTVLVAEPGNSMPVVEINTPLADLYLDSDHGLSSVIQLGYQWTEAFIRTVAFEAGKPRHTQRPATTPVTPARLSTVAEQFQIEAVVHDADMLRTIVPDIPDVASGTTINASGLIGSDTLSAYLEVTAPQFASPSVSSGSFELTAHLQSRYAAILTEYLTGDVRLATSTLTVGDQLLQNGLFELSYANETLDLSAIGNGLLGNKQNQVTLLGTLHVQDTVNHFSIEQLEIDLGGYTWETDSGDGFDLFSDGIVIQDLAFTQPEAETPQRLSISGALSTSPSDTLFADIEHIDVERLAGLGSIRPFNRDLGGLINGRLAVTNLLQRPEVTGHISIPEFSLGNRILGRLDLNSSLEPDAEAVQVELAIDRPDTELVLTEEVRLEENELTVGGQVRFPGRNEDGSRDAGHLNLDLEIDRADMFFFDFLFPSVVAGTNGYLTGDGSIGGDFSYPLFNADLRAINASTEIPRFGLQIDIEGPVRVDRQGIHLSDVSLEDKANGTGQISGSILFNDYRYFSLDLTAALQNVEIIDVSSSSELPFYGHIQASGTAGVTGPLDNVFLRSTDATTTSESEIFIPIRSGGIQQDRGFLVFADSTGQIPDTQERTSLIGPKPDSERSFTEGLEMDLNISAPPGSEVHLVFDPSIGDAINATGSAEIQLAINEGRFQTFGTFTASGGDYLFTAGEVFTRRFEIEPGGTLTWDGDPLDAQMDLIADYRTRASLAGLGLAGLEGQRVPLVIRTDIGGRLSTPNVSLAINLDADQRTNTSASAAVEALRPILNDPERQALYASSVLLTGTFLLAPADDLTSTGSAISEAADELLFTSLSQLVSSRLNLFLNQALASDNLELLFGLQPVEALQRFDLTYGVALRLLDERLIIRGEGVYQQYESQSAESTLEGELAVEVRLSSKVSLEVFYRRESELLGGTSIGTTPYGSYGVGINYETQFTSWQNVLRGILGREQANEPGT